MTTEHSEAPGGDAGPEPVESDRPAPNVVLVGPPGAGKSTIGRKLARELGVDLYDTDAGIEERAGRTIPEIFAEDGEPEFRRMEEEVVRDAVLAGHGVVSLGGGSVLSAATRALLRGRTVVYLEISVGEGLRRTGASSNRPLLNGDDPAKKYRELMKIRRPLYREVASIRVRTDGRSPGRVVRMILAKLGLEPRPRPGDSVTDTVEPGVSATSRARRKRRRGGRGGRENPAVTANTAAADSDTAASRPGQDASAQSGDSSGGPEGPKRRRNRRPRRRGGRRPADSATGTTASGTAPDTDTAAPSPSGDRPGTASAADSGSAPSTRGRRRRAARAAGAPVNPAGAATDSPQASSSGARPDGGQSASAPGDQRDSARAPGAVAPPGSGRSRRARARRARARARAEHGADQSAQAESEQQA